MKGMSFGNSPMKQDEMGKKVTPGKEVKPKFKLMSATKNDGTKEYFKVSGGTSTDGGKTFTKSIKVKISEAEYNSMMAQ